ncbi:hypothetical protein Tco_1404014 [Tanacetum coccineum]
MSKGCYNWIMTTPLEPRKDFKSPSGINSFTGRVRGMPIFIGNFTYASDFMIVEDISSVIDPRLSPAVLGKPFVELSDMNYDLSLGVVKFTKGVEEISYKMPYKIEEYNSLVDMEKENMKSVYFRNKEDKRKGVEYVMSKILRFYKESLELGPEYRIRLEESESNGNQGGVTEMKKKEFDVPHLICLPTSNQSSTTICDDPIPYLNKAMAFMSIVVASRFSSTNNQLKTSSNLRNQATIQDGRVTIQQVQRRQGQGHMARQCTKPKWPMNSTWFKEKILCSVDKNYFDIQKKEVSLDNDRLLDHIICQDVKNIKTHADFIPVNVLFANKCLVNDNLAIERLE